MSVLAKIQHDFFQSIQGGQAYQNFLHHIRETKQSSEVLLKIYHNNIFSAHYQALARHYPLVFSIIGSSTAILAVRHYLITDFPENFSRSGCLEEWGEKFATFINRYKLTNSCPYLSEIAQFEWAKHQASRAPEAPLLTSAEQEQVKLLLQLDLTFHFQKSCQLIAFTHTLEHIISDSSCDACLLKNKADYTDPSYGLILKQQGQIKVYWLSPSLFIFLNCLKEGQDSDVACAAAQVLDPNFNIQATFDFLFASPILQKINSDSSYSAQP